MQIICSSAKAFAGTIATNSNSKISGLVNRNKRKLWLFGGSSSSMDDIDKRKKDKKKKDKKKKDEDGGGKSSSKPKSTPKVVSAPSISLSACVLAVYGSPITYYDESPAIADNSKDVAVLSEDDSDDLDRRMMRVLHQAFPSWYSDSGMSHAMSPSEDTSWRNPLKNMTAYPRSGRLNSFCLKY